MHIIPRSSLHIPITYSSGRFWLSHNRFSSKNTARLSSKSAFCCSKLFFICSARLCSYKRRDYISISNIYSCHICSLFGETCVSRGWVTLPNPPFSPSIASHLPKQAATMCYSYALFHKHLRMLLP